MDRNEEYPQFEFKPFPPRKMLYAAPFAIVIALITHSFVVCRDYYCPKRLADYNARQQAAHKPAQASIQDPVIAVDKDIAVIAVGGSVSVFDTEDFSRAQAVVARGEVDFVSARILLLQMSHAAGV